MPQTTTGVHSWESAHPPILLELTTPMLQSPKSPGLVSPIAPSSLHQSPKRNSHPTDNLQHNNIYNLNTNPFNLPLIISTTHRSSQEEYKSQSTKPTATILPPPYPMYIKIQAVKYKGVKNASSTDLISISLVPRKAIPTITPRILLNLSGKQVTEILKSPPSGKPPQELSPTQSPNMGRTTPKRNFPHLL